MPTNSRHRKPNILTLAMSGMLLSGCGGFSVGSDITSLGRYVAAATSVHRVTLDEAAAVPYASMGFSVDGGPEYLVVQVKGAGNDDLWSSSARHALVTRDGRIIKSAGLAYNLGGLQKVSEKSLQNGAEEILWSADFPDLGIYGAVISCQRHAAGEEVIDILGKAIRTQRTDEVCTSVTRSLSWSFKNSFWSSGRLIWRTSQHIHPHLGVVDTELLRPPVR